MKADLLSTYKELLPSFYTDVFKDQGTLNQILQGVSILQTQTQADAARNEAYTSIFDAEPLHTSPVDRLRLTKTERTSITYGSGINYGDTNVVFGQQATSAYGIYDTEDVSIKSIGYISDTINDPTHIYTEGIDFFVDNGLIIFIEPLGDMFPGIFGQDIDTLIAEPQFKLVGYNVRRDKQDLSKQFGYVLGVDAPPTTAGKDVLAGLWKLHTFGPSWYWTLFTLCRALGADVIRTKEEEVLAIKANTTYGSVVVTDKNTYNISGTPVDVGDIIPYGYPASSDMSILHELANSFAAGVPGVVDLEDQDGAVIIQAYTAISDLGIGQVYLLPANLILIDIDPGISDTETSKLTDIFGDVLSKNTRLIIIFGVAGADGANASQASINDDPLSITADIMEATTSTNRTLGSSKSKTSIR